MTDHKKPDCFASQKAWDDYVHEAAASQWNPQRFCRDCTPKVRDSMTAAGRCQYPETVFVVISGEVVGFRVDDPGWMGALTGRYSNSGKRSVMQVVVCASRETVEKGDK